MTLFIASVWFVNGLFCKVLDLVPRHREIVTGIIGYGHARIWTLLIGIAEIIMALWILTGVHPKFNVVVQILVITAMTVLEVMIVPELLLWGRTNAFFALLFILSIYYNGFHSDKKLSLK